MTTHIAALIAELRAEAAGPDSRDMGLGEVRANAYRDAVTRLEAAAAQDAEVTRALAVFFEDALGTAATDRYDSDGGAIAMFVADHYSGLVDKHGEPTPLGERALKLAEEG